MEFVASERLKDSEVSGARQRKLECTRRTDKCVASSPLGGRDGGLFCKKSSTSSLLN